MRAKHFLRQLSVLDNLINDKVEEIRRLRDFAVSISINYEGERVSTSGVGNPVGETVVKYISLEEELKEELYKLEIMRRNILSVIDRLPSAEHQVLREIYVKRRTYYEVMDTLDRSRSWVRNHHSNGLKAVQKILDTEEIEWQYQEPNEQEQKKN